MVFPNALDLCCFEIHEPKIFAYVSVDLKRLVINTDNPLKEYHLEIKGDCAFVYST